MRIIQIVGYKNAGKTTLACEIVSMLAERGLRVGTLKRDAHDFEPDIPGTDTWKHRHAGAAATAIASAARTAWFEERPSELAQLVDGMIARSIEALIVEGFKNAEYPKIVLLRSPEDTDLLALSNVVAIVTRFPQKDATAKPAGTPEACNVHGASAAEENSEALAVPDAAEALDFSEAQPLSHSFEYLEKSLPEGIPVFTAPDADYGAVLAFVRRYFA